MTATQTSNINNIDPFADHHETLEEERDFLTGCTLSVGRNATLTLATDALIVLDEGLREHPRQLCCGILPSRSTSIRSIPYFNILWAELTKFDIVIHYAKPVTKSPKSSVRASVIEYTLDSSRSSVIEFATRWTKHLLDRSYLGCQRQKRIKLLVNPYGGQGKAQKIVKRDIEPIFVAARCTLDIERTAYSGHAVEIAEKIDVEAFDVLACASGDGLPHECFNGLARKPNASEALRKIAVVQLPCGSGNAMSWNLNGTGDPSFAALAIVKGIRTSLDLASITQIDEANGGHVKRSLSFLSQSIGIIAESDLGTDNIRWMGDARFTYGFVTRVLGKTIYPCDIAVKLELGSKQDIKRHYATEMMRISEKERLTRKDIEDALANSNELDTSFGLGLPPLENGTIKDPLPAPVPQGEPGWTALQPYDNLGNFYCGNMAYMMESTPFFPASLPSDGMLDLVTIPGDVPRMKAFEMLFAVEKGTFFDMPEVASRKVSAIRVIPRFGKWAGKPTSASASSIHEDMETHGQSATTSNGKVVKDGGYFAVDGEKFPFEPFQIEVHKGLGTVLSVNESRYESLGPAGWEEIYKQINLEQREEERRAREAGENMDSQDRDTSSGSSHDSAVAGPSPGKLIIRGQTA